MKLLFLIDVIRCCMLPCMASYFVNDSLPWPLTGSGRRDLPTNLTLQSRLAQQIVVCSSWFVFTPLPALGEEAYVITSQFIVVYFGLGSEVRGKCRSEQRDIRDERKIRQISAWIAPLLSYCLLAHSMKVKNTM